jgi:hypothetical protein
MIILFAGSYLVLQQVETRWRERFIMQIWGYLVKNIVLLASDMSIVPLIYCILQVYSA